MSSSVMPSESSSRSSLDETEEKRVVGETSFVSGYKIGLVVDSLRNKEQPLKTATEEKSTRLSDDESNCEFSDRQGSRSPPREDGVDLNAKEDAKEHWKCLIKYQPKGPKAVTKDTEASIVTTLAPAGVSALMGSLALAAMHPQTMGEAMTKPVEIGGRIGGGKRGGFSGDGARGGDLNASMESSSSRKKTRTKGRSAKTSSKVAGENKHASSPGGDQKRREHSRRGNGKNISSKEPSITSVSSRDTSMSKQKTTLNLGPKKKDPIRDFIRDECEDLFGRLDISGKGYLTCEDVQAAYLQMGMEYSEELCKEILDEFDTEGEGRVNVEDFHGTMKEEIARGTTDDQLEFVFQILDHNKDGYLDVSDIQLVFEREGVMLDKRDVMDMMIESGTTSGIMDLNEFKRLARKLDVHSKLTTQLNELIV